MRYWLIAGILLLPSGLFASQQFRGPHVGILSSTRAVAQAPGEGGGGGGGATLVQQRNAQGSASLAYTSPVTAGNLLVMFSDGYVTPGPCVPSSIGSSNGNTWNIIQTSGSAGNANLQLMIGYAQNANSGNETVTVNYSGSCSIQTLFIAEYSGLSTTNALDYSNATGGTGTQSNSNNLIASASTKLMISAAAIDAGGTQVLAQVNPWTQTFRETDGNGSWAGSFATLGTTSTFVADQVYRSTHNHTNAAWVSMGASFK